MEKQTGRFKSKKSFTAVPNTVVTDPNLSTAALGLYTKIYSLITRENFILYKSYLETICKEGERAFNTMWSELKNMGYLIQTKYKAEDGKWAYEYELLDEPRKTGETTADDNENKEAPVNKSQKNSTSFYKKPDPQNVGVVLEKPGVRFAGVENAGLQNVGVNNKIVENKIVSNNTYSSSSSINSTNTPREDASDKVIPLEEDDEKELNSVTRTLFKGSYGKRLSSIPGQYGCDGNMIYPALKLALENGALELIPYVKSIFKEWKGQGIRHLSDLGIASLTTRDQENEIISVYLDELARDNEDPRKYDPDLPDFMLKLNNGQYYRDRSSEVRALSKLYSYNDIFERFRKTAIAHQPINEAVKYMVNDYS